MTPELVSPRLYYLATPAGMLLAEIGGGAGLFEDCEALWNAPDAAAILTFEQKDDARRCADALVAVHGELVVCCR